MVRARILARCQRKKYAHGWTRLLMMVSMVHVIPGKWLYPWMTRWVSVMFVAFMDDSVVVWSSFRSWMTPFFTMVFDVSQKCVHSSSEQFCCCFAGKDRVIHYSVTCLLINWKERIISLMFLQRPRLLVVYLERISASVLYTVEFQFPKISGGFSETGWMFITWSGRDGSGLCCMNFTCLVKNKTKSLFVVEHHLWMGSFCTCTSIHFVPVLFLSAMVT